MARGLGLNPRAGCRGIAGLLRGALSAAATTAARDPTEFLPKVVARLAEHAAHVCEAIARREAEERDLVERMHADRVRAAAALVVADERLIASVAKGEGHLSQELARVVEMLECLKADRSGGGPNPPHGGFVFPGGHFDDPGTGGRPILPFVSG